MSSETGSSEHDDEEVRADSLGPRMDENFLNESARRSRMPHDRPTEHELAFFPEIWDCKTAIEIFLMIRNTTLATWLTNQWKECTAADVRNNLFPPFNSDLDMIQNIVHYLSRHAIINFGRYTRVIKIKPRMFRQQRDVIVIGAGAAGIAAATQLTTFGFNVIMVEARNRIGGRAQNYKSKNDVVMELGADSLRNLEDSPIATLMHQVQMEQHAAFDNQSMFIEGKPVDPKRDRLIAGMYISARGALHWQAHNREHRDENGKFISRQQAYENVINLVERGTHIKYFNYCKSMEEVARAREYHFNQMAQLRMTAMLAEKRVDQMKDGEDPLLRRSLKRDIVTTMQKFEEVAQAFETANSHLELLKKNPASKQYMHPMDFRNWNFLLGFEEYLYGAPLEKVQFSCDAHKNKKHGVVTRLTDGIAALLTSVAQKRNLDIRLNHRVRTIDWSPSHRGVKLSVEKGDGEIVDMNAAFVISTLPIGVLKKTIQNDPRAPKFTPPLPEEKVEAIRCLGSGLINKCVLQYDKAFWEPSDRYHFITISPNIRTRGSQLLWSAVPGSTVITTYMVGESANTTLDDQIIIDMAKDALEKIFRQTGTLIDAKVTHWQDDEFAFGSGSFMSLRTEMKHFEELCHPLEVHDEKKKRAMPRVLFAGEHTCPSYTATVQGAWMSGARAAADLANEICGVGFTDLTMDAGGRGDGKDEEEEEDSDIEFIEDVDRPMPEQ
uniref:SWIRM domain-containing protein n=1 Tax=Caenorhabditis japonica TaxID=281687 RepID=A0A8R1HYS9_CAEJA